MPNLVIYYKKRLILEYFYKPFNQYHIGINYRMYIIYHGLYYYLIR